MSWWKSNISKKSTLLTAVLLLFQLQLLILQACYTNPEFEDDLCGVVRRANVIEVSQVFFSPFINGLYSEKEDTVKVEDFRFNFELEYEAIQSSSLHFPGQCIARDCEPKFNVQNISNIQILLKEPFMDLPPGTDIAYLFRFADGTQLSRFREFNRMSQFFTLTFHGETTRAERMKTDFLIFLRNGEQLKFSSTSPYIIN
ncbi:MAG: hypothetical protein EA341_00700 [Mongoliibacter sp.]|uniref:hypothetical protein n=1 Tax=Mongoliibacter sp. TaxID=2022438 RepID=UPI0012EFFAC2|nr:hypothetical protein [Mongoliibacter sp.]TVP53734.1 MAG: hypothetical protein EA341_00700 [Mongoliibacter sp.]